MKKFLVALMVMGFGFAANADRGLEVQINGSALGTSGGITMNDEDNGDNTVWNLGGEVYKSLNDNLQIGGILMVSDQDTGDTMIGLGLAGRYNFSSELRDSMFAGLGVTYMDFGAADQIAAHIQFGKRYALSDTITWTPNLHVQMDVAGDDDSGMSINLNLLSFSGFM